MLKTLGIGDESEDLAQVIAFRLWTHKETIQSKEQFEAYAFHVARWLRIDFLRSRSKELGHEDIDNLAEELIDPTAAPAEATEAAQLIDVLLRRLSERERLAMELQLDGLSAEEIAAKMKISEASVRSLVRFARIRLRNILAQIEGRLPVTKG